MTGHPKAPAGGPRLVARRRAPADRRLWWEPWTWRIEDGHGNSYFAAYFGREDVPEPWEGLELWVNGQGYGLDRSRPGVHHVGMGVLYRVPEQCEEYAWPLYEAWPLRNACPLCHGPIPPPKVRLNGRA